MIISVGSVILAFIAMFVYRFLGNKIGQIDYGEENLKHSILLKGSRALDLRDIMMMIVSLVVLGGAMYVILSQKYDSGTQKWAFGAIGSIVGFWLKPE